MKGTISRTLLLAFLLVAVQTGLRLSEMTGLTRDDERVEFILTDSGREAEQPAATLRTKERTAEVVLI